MIEKTFIYGLICPTDNVIKYIGKANFPEKRLREHQQKGALKKNTLKNAWIKSLHAKGLTPILTILEECNSDIWQERESYWIEQYKPSKNSTSGGEGLHNPSTSTRLKISNLKKNNTIWLGRQHTEETKAKISEKAKGRVSKTKGVSFHTEETKALLSRLHKGKRLSEEHKLKLRRKGEEHPFYGKHHTEESKQKISEAKKGKKQSKEHKDKVAKSWELKTPQGETITVHNLREFARENGLNVDCLYQTFKGKTKQHKGYVVLSQITV